MTGKATPIRIAGLAVALVLTCLATAAGADPVAWRGTLGRLEIVVELTGDPGSAPSGRYFYLRNGIDIPLHSMRLDGGVLELVEEEPCNREACPPDAGARLGATWTLSASADGSLQGSWKGARSFPVSLRRVGSRPGGRNEEALPLALFEASQRLTYTDVVVDQRTHPYEFVNLDVDYDIGGATDWDGAAFAYAADPRTRFRYPRVVRLPGGASPDAAYRLLTQRHWRMNIGAFRCPALGYVGFHAFPGNWGVEDDTMGGFEDISVAVTQLSGRVMSWTETGSIWCGDASPSNFHSAWLMDVERGEILGMADIFRGWTASGPGAGLLDFVGSRREKPANRMDLVFEEECGIEDLMKTDLSARLVRGEGGSTLVTFGLYDLPTVIAACAGDL